MDPPDSEFRTPGQLIQARLQQRGWTQRVLAVVLGINDATVNHIISGKRPLRADLALAIGELLDILPEQLLKLQNEYDLAQARIVARPDPKRAQRAKIFGDLPVADMIKRSWIDAKSVRDIEAVESGLIRFFGVNSLDEIDVLPHAAKRSNVAEGTIPAQMAWLYRARTIASDMVVPRFSQASTAATIPRLRELLIAPEETRKVPRLLAESGIRFVIVEALPGSKIDGACFWLDENAPVVAMSLRFDRIDNFWFVLRHELEHVIQRHGFVSAAIDVELEGLRSGNGESIPEEERVANEAAQEFCVPSAAMERFIARKAPFFRERDILGFARTHGVHPGLVAGQLQRRTGRYDRFRTHLVKVRAHVSPSAIVDGWGDVAPIDD